MDIGQRIALCFGPAIVDRLDYGGSMATYLELEGIDALDSPEAAACISEKEEEIQYCHVNVSLALSDIL